MIVQVAGDVVADHLTINFVGKMAIMPVNALTSPHLQVVANQFMQIWHRLFTTTTTPLILLWTCMLTRVHLPTLPLLPQISPLPSHT